MTIHSNARARAIFVASALLPGAAMPAQAAYVADCMQYGGAVECIPADLPQPVEGDYDPDITVYNGCRRLELDGPPKHSGGSSYKAVSRCSSDFEYPPPYVAVNNCTNFAPCNAYYPVLVSFGTTCRPGYSPTIDLTPDTGVRLCSAAYVVDRYHDKPQSCQKGYGRPIFPLTGSKRLSVDLGVYSPHWLELGYDTRRKVPSNDAYVSYRPAASASFGALWETNLHRKLVLQNNAYDAAQVSRGRGAWVSFVENAARVFEPDADIADRLVAINDGWRYYDAAARAQEDYDSAGQLLTIARADGARFTFAYSTGVVAGVSPAAGLLISVTDQMGRPLRFNYEQIGSAPPRIYQIVRPDGAIIEAAYDAAGNLSTLTWPDAKTRQFLYERADLPWALTGVIDESGERNVTYGYDDKGRANDTQAAAGADHFHATWDVAPSWQITESYAHGILWRDHRWVTPQNTVVTLSNGQSATLSAVDVLGAPRIGVQSQPGGSGCDASTGQLQYDERGNVIDRLDFNQVRSCHAYAADRNVEISRVEGLSASQTCPVANAGAGQRKISTKWHPAWPLEVRRAEPKRITTTVYNGEPDPLNGNTVATCVTDDPRLPDGSRLALVCKRYETSTDDDTGNLDFSAAAKEQRSWSYQYNRFGQVTLEIDPRGKRTTYDYWADTAFTGDGMAARGHWQGDLKTSRNALGQVTRHTHYNKRGQVLTVQLPNGSTEQREYHARGWLTKTSQVPAGGGSALTTRFEYHDTGLLKKVTQPDGSFASYTWDAAHRLTDVTDSVGNTVHYELDDAGNRIAEKFKDPQGTLAKTITRTFDALGRLSSSSGMQ